MSVAQTTSVTDGHDERGLRKVTDEHNEHGLRKLASLLDGF
jgi:hypothetical protein